MENTGTVSKIIEGLKLWSRLNSPWLIHFNSGSCNGCDIEILATLTPRYDLERFGVKLQGSPTACGCAGLYRSGHTPGPRALAAHLRTDARAKICRGGRFVRHLGWRFRRLLQCGRVHR